MAATTSTPARRRRAVPAVEYPVTRVLITNVRTGATCRIPGLRFTLADLQACVTGRERSGTANVICATCGESVADCIELRDKLRGVPHSWSWESHVDQA
jgi:hypothetical protein